jgi:hypothetical protein
MEQQYIYRNKSRLREKQTNIHFRKIKQNILTKNRTWNERERGRERERERERER